MTTTVQTLGGRTTEEEILLTQMTRGTRTIGLTTGLANFSHIASISQN